MCNNNNNMLKTNKLKEHLMIDSRWSVLDKLQQYQAIINLYGREQKLIGFDTNKTKELNIKRIHDLRSTIKTKRLQFINNNNNKSSIPTLLLSTNNNNDNTTIDHHHKQLQLKYQKQQDINKIVDDLKQMNYGKKKAFDQLIFKRKQQTIILKELKLKLGDLEDRAHIEYPLEERAQMIRAQIQDTKLKQNVATIIQRNFTNILHTMKKDAIFFDSILCTLERDQREQAKCLYRTTQLGQLATEYLDDRIHDYKQLEAAIHCSMTQRQNNIQMIQQQIKETTNCLKHLLAAQDKDSTELTQYKARRTQSELNLNGNIESIESILKFIQNTTYVGQFEQILPRMHEQHEQFNRLFTIANHHSTILSSILKKRNHLQLMYDTLATTIADTTYIYIEQKNRDMKISLEYVEHLKEINKEYCEIGSIYLNIHVSLQQLYELTQCVVNHTGNELSTNTKPNHPIIDVNQLLHILNERYHLLINNYIDDFNDNDKKTAAIDLYQKVLMDASNQAHIHDFDQIMDKTSLISDIELDDPTIPSREEIKKRSTRIVQDCAKKDDDQPIILLPLRDKTY